VLGLAADRLARQGAEAPWLAGLPAGQVLAAFVAGGWLATSAEAWLLHFRGAFHDPFMYLPVTVPPLAAAALAAATVRPVPRVRHTAKRLAWATAALGLGGVGFHVYGIHRNMGGWYNWSQMILQGPPIPAPPGFTGLAFGALAALSLLEGETP
jgi:hypothetical protein